jgi:acyl-CoA thioesterase-1
VSPRTSIRGSLMVLVYLTAAACANAAEPAPFKTPLVIFLGDSLSAGYGLPAEQAFPALVERRMKERGTPVRIVNAGVSGDTTSGGLDRLDWLLGQKPDVLVVELGANDAFRGQPVSRIESNLRAIVVRAQQAGVRVLIVGMKVPTNYGPDYTQAFDALYPRVAKETHAALMPFLLDGVGGRPELNLDDGIHPNVLGQKIVAENFLPYLERVLRAR